MVQFETTDPALRGEMTIMIALADADGGTDVLAVHDGLPRGLSTTDNEVGWQMSLAKLAALVRNCALISFLAVLRWPMAYAVAEENVIVNHTSGTRTELDDLIHEHFGKQYKVVDVNDGERGYVSPKGTSGFGPTPPVYVQDRCVRGIVLVLYVIMIDGSVTSPYVANSSDPLLSEIAVRSMSDRQFRPAQVDGKPVSSVAGSRFVFRCPDQSGAPAGDPPAGDT